MPSPEDEINKRYRDLWIEYWPKLQDKPDLQELFKTWPLQYPPNSLKREKPLFVGLNPAYNEEKIENKARELVNEPNILKLYDDSHNLFSVERLKEVFNDESRIKKIGKLGNYFLQNYSYYTQIGKLSEDVWGKGTPWTHLDVLPVGYTNQKTVIKWLKLTKNDDGIEKEFVSSSVSIFLDIIDKLRPSCIIVVNGFISQMIIDGADEKIAKSNFMTSLNSGSVIEASHLKDFGFRNFRVKGVKYPLVLTGMLSGQRALDKASKEGLIWYLSNRNVTKKMEEIYQESIQRVRDINAQQ